MKIRWIGQSGYIVKTQTTEIVIDPYLSDMVNRVSGYARLVAPPLKPEEIDADAVICTHHHMDHLDTDAVMQMDDRLRFITTNEGKAALLSLGKTNVAALNTGDSIQIGDMQITAVFAKHTTEAFGVILKAEGKTLYFSGDTLFDEALYEIAAYRPYITFICINGRLGNMDVEEAVRTAKKIGAKINVPNHYGMFAANTEDPGKFVGRVANGLEMEFNREYDM